MPLPPALLRRLDDEPRWIDLRAYRGASADARFKELAADFAAAIHGIPKEDLLSQEVRQQRRALSLAWSAIAALALLLVAAGWEWRVAVGQTREALSQRNNLIAELAGAQLSRGNKDAAMRLAMHAIGQQLDLDPGAAASSIPGAVLAEIVTQAQWRVLACGTRTVLGTARPMFARRVEDRCSLDAVTGSGDRHALPLPRCGYRSLVRVRLQHAPVAIGARAIEHAWSKAARPTTKPAS